MLSVNDGIAILPGGEVPGTANESSIDINKGLRGADLEDRVTGIGPDQL
jgi:hypothetical protein